MAPDAHLICLQHAANSFLRYPQESEIDSRQGALSGERDAGT